MSNKISILFFGTPPFAAQCLQALIGNDQYQVVGVVTNPDRPAGRGKNLMPSPVKEVAQKYGLPLFQVPSLKKELAAFKEWCATLGQIDVGVVVAFGQILSAEVLSIPHHGCINVHASILPRWRGAAPINRAIMAGDAETGVALMRMEEGLDTGGVYSEERIALKDEDIASEVHDSLAQLGAKLLREDIGKITSGALPLKPQILTPQDESLVTYAKKITNEELKIDWSLPAREILHFIHGVSYRPGAFTFINGTRLKIFRVKIESGRASLPSEPPGAVLFAHGNILAIKAGDNNAIHILEAQLEGKKILPAAEILLGGAFSPGDILK